MPRRPNPIPDARLNLRLPEDIRTRVDLELFSAAEGRVPLGAYQRWFIERIQEYFRNRRLDLAPYAGCDAGVFEVSGSPAALEILKRVLKGEVPV